MLFRDFIRHLDDGQPPPIVRVGLLIELVNTRHLGVGEVERRWFDGPSNCLPGTFIWWAPERTSPYEEGFNNATIFLDRKIERDVPMRRIVTAKELMHVFDTAERQVGNPDAFVSLTGDIEAEPLPGDASAMYLADEAAVWMAILALIPPPLRAAAHGAWADKTVTTAELAWRWRVPEIVAARAMGSYYETAQHRFLG